MGDKRGTRRVKGLTPEEEKIARETPGGTVDKLRAVYASQPVEERVRQARQSGIQIGMTLAQAARSGQREPSEDAVLTRHMSLTELAKLTMTEDPRGERFYKRYVETGTISARQVKNRQRVWVFDVEELQVNSPELDADAVRPG